MDKAGNSSLHYAAGYGRQDSNSMSCVPNAALPLWLGQGLRAHVAVAFDFVLLHWVLEPHPGDVGISLGSRRRCEQG